ncbi:LysR substrate-binding domain-containing protein [Pararoseomonas sp. SCSIO 73927]|uniref:LysR substrate-binding domain-containing protein n=1 Tax=Pararoseomonas sp. SCSIO 73927 TaxID=3114537 RepID=UPI0030D37E88
MPALQRLLPEFPDIKVEIVIDYGLTDIVAERLDAGIRRGETVAQGMISVPIGAPLRMTVFGSPAYFAGREKPAKPQDLTAHSCIDLRLPTRGGLYAWEFGTARRQLRVRVEGQLVFNSTALILAAATAGLGLGYLTEQQVRPHLQDGRLVRVLADWCEPFPGHHLYYPSRRQQTPAFSLFVEALRHEG